MAAEIDSLEIKINAKAESAKDSIDTLVKKLDALSASLGKINGGSFSGLASGVQKLGNATQTLKSVKASDYNRIANGFKKFAEIDGNKLSQTAGGLNVLAGSMSLLSNVKGTENVTPVINAIKNLARVDMSGFDTTKMNTIASTVSNFALQLSGISYIESSVVRLVSAMARLAGTGSSIGGVETNFESLGKKVVSFSYSMASVGSIDANLARLIDGIAKLASAGTKIPTTAANMTALGNGVKQLLTTLSSAPAVNTNLANMIQGLGNIASSGSRTGTVTNNLANGMSRTSSGAWKATKAFHKLHDMIKKTNKSSNGLASSIGMFYAKFFMVIRAVKSFGKSIKGAQDYIEEFNYFSVAMDKIGQDSARQYKKAGYKSAEAYAKSFRTRFEKLQKQMTGYGVDYDTGEATSQLAHNLGLNLTEVMNYNAAISQITNSAGMLGETSVMASKALSMLSADWSSLSNQDLSAVMDNFQSGVIGQSKALYKYGIDITSVGLAQTALNHGITTSVKNMSQQSKMQLRVLTMLEQSKVAYGDLARTINQPANQLRMLQAGFKKLSTTIGNIFMPTVQKTYPYLNAMVMVLQEFAQWIAKLTGAKIEDTSFSVPDYEPAEDGSEAIADNTEKAAKSAKKLSDNLQGFDIINKLDKKNDDDEDDDDKKNANIDLSKEIKKALSGYEKIWNDAFRSNQNKAVQLARKIKKALLSGWKTGDFSEVGKALANWINKGLKSVPWGKINKTTQNIAKSIATFLNGYIENLDWKIIGKTFVGGVNTVVEAGYIFAKTFDWLLFGKSIQTGVKSAIINFNSQEAGKLLGSGLRGMIQFAFGVMVDFPYETLGKKISDYINGFLEDMGKVDEKTGLSGWQEIGKTVNDSLNGILVTINTALSNVEWSNAGKSIGDFLGQIHWGEIFMNTGNAIGKALFGAAKTGISAFMSNPKGVSSALTVAFGAIFTYKKIKGIFDAIKLSKIVGNAVSAAQIAGIIQSANSSSLVSAASLLVKTFKRTLVSSIAGSNIGSAMIGAITGFETAIKKLCSGILSKLCKAFSSTAFVSTVSIAFVAAIAAAIAGVAIGDRINEAINAINFTGKYELKAPEKMVKNAEQANDELQKTRERVQGIKSDIKSINESVKTTDGKNVSDLANKYFELSKKTNPTASDIAVMKQYSEELSSVIPGLSKNIDKQTGAFKGSKNELNGLLDSLNKTAKAEAAYNASVKLFESEQENNKAIKEKTEQYEKYKKELEAAQKVAEKVKKEAGVGSERYKNQVRVVGTYATKVNAARAELDLLNKANKDISEQTKKNNNIMAYAKVKTNNYSDATKKLKKVMEEFGVEAKTSKYVVKELKEKLESGEISWKEYKNLVNGSYSSTEQLNNAIAKLSPKSVDITTNVYGESNVKSVSASVNGLPTNKKVKVDVDTSNGAKTLKEFREQIKKKAKIPVFVQYGITKEAKKKLASLPKPGGDYAFKNALEHTGLGKLSKYLDSLPAYKTGGFPEDGLFMANRSELVGKFSNGKTAVANNEQITQGFADGITKTLAPAIYSAVKQAVSEMPTQGNADVYLDGKKVSETVVGHINKISKSRGNSPLWGIN